MSIRTSFLLGGALISHAVFAAAPAVDALTKPCADCHGVAGVSSVANAPHLNGQLAAYLEEDIAALAKGGRVSAVPNHVPPSWTGPEIAAVAKFYAASMAPRPVQATDPQLVAKGQAIYENHCAECHPDNGRQSDHDAPLMAGQNLDYIMQQTRLFVAGKRKFAFMMGDAFRGLSAADLDAVAHFFASQNQFKK
jgi:sulfide dehydrogenase cytochrome subunit